MKGTIFNIQRFSLNDGPGIRTTVFMKGCNLKCRWCHNPEGISNKITIQYIDKKCVGCRLCAKVCENNVHTFNTKHEIDFEKCKSCFKCIDICKTHALIINGKQVEASELSKELLKDQDYFDEKGGITFSGGEPLLQTDFLIDIARLLKEHNIHIAIDTALNIEFAKIEKILPFVDLFLIDIKAISQELHYKHTSVNNNLIKENIKKIDKLGKLIWIRIPVIGGFNDNDEEMLRIKEFIDNLHQIKRVTLIPYHTMGYEKYQSIGLKCHMSDYYEVDNDILEKYKKLFSKYIK